MSFSDFKSANSVAEKYNLTIQRHLLFDHAAIVPIAPHAFLQQTLEFEVTHQPSNMTEYGLCESLIYPLLRDMWMNYPQLQIWSHVPLIVDDDLNGIPDYIITEKSPQGLEQFDRPLLTVVEAKRDNFVEGWGQCLAGMVAAQKLNQSPNRKVYGIVTTGQVWEFGLLHGSQFTLHPFKFSLVQLELLLGVLGWLFQASLV